MKKCEDCDECTYIGEGDYVCIKDEPKIVITEFIIATDDYGQCGSKNKKLSRKPPKVFQDSANGLYEYSQKHYNT